MRIRWWEIRERRKVIKRSKMSRRSWEPIRKGGRLGIRFRISPWSISRMAELKRLLEVHLVSGGCLTCRLRFFYIDRVTGHHMG